METTLKGSPKVRMAKKPNLLYRMLEARLLLGTPLGNFSSEPFERNAFAGIKLRGSFVNGGQRSRIFFRSHLNWMIEL